MFMRSNSGNWKVPKMRCQLAAKYVASKPVALPEMPQKTQFDAQTLSIIESAEVENKVLGKNVEDDAKAFHDDMCAIVLEQGWAKEFEAERRKLKELGYSDEDVAMALMVVPNMAGNGARGERPSLDDLTAFLENRRKMQGMGFSKQAICGALMEFKNDLEDAVAHCAGFA